MNVFLRVAVLSAMALGVVLALPSGAARAATFQIGDTVYVGTDYLNLRSDAGTDGTVRDVLVYGEQLEVVGGPRADDGIVWYRVGVDSTGLVGWVAEDYITYSLDGGDGGSGFVGAPGVRVVDGPVNVRSSAGLGASIKGTLETGAEVPTYAGSGDVDSADGYDWIRILYGNGIEGWVATDYLVALDYSPNLGSDDSWTIFEGVEVIDGPVNMRAEPSTSADILMVGQTGALFYRWADSDLFNADGYMWAKVKSFSLGQPAYIAIDFLAPVLDMPCMDGPCYPGEVVPFLSATEAVVTDGPVNFRADASTSGAILMTLEDGDYLFLDPQDNRYPPSEDGHFWIAATVDGRFGYVALDFITALD